MTDPDSGEQLKEYFERWRRLLGMVPVAPTLPASGCDPEGEEDLMRSLQGATILRIGGISVQSIGGKQPEGGGLVLDYITAGSSDAKRVVFAFNELGMWVEFQGAAG